MPYALVANGQPTKLTPGLPIWVGDVQYPWSIIELWSEADLAALGVVTYVDPAEPPAGYRATGSVLALENGTVTATLTTEAIPLDDLKASRLRDASTVYAANLAAGYPVTLGGNAETLQCRNDHDRTNWLGLLIGAQTAVALGQGAADYPIKLRCTSNAEYTVTNDAAVLLMLGLLNWAGATMAAYWAVKDAITEAGNTPTLNAVNLEAGYP